MPCRARLSRSGEPNVRAKMPSRMAPQVALRMLAGTTLQCEAVAPGAEVGWGGGGYFALTATVLLPAFVDPLAFPFAAAFPFFPCPGATGPGAWANSPLRRAIFLPPISTSSLPFHLGRRSLRGLQVARR